MKNVLVTGGAGYIGSHACKALKQRGYNPVVFDNLSTGWKDAVKFGPLEIGDLLNKQEIEQCFERYSPVAVMHFAALSQVGESIRNPFLYWENNVIGTLNLLQSAVEYNCLNFIFSSTCATYGDQDSVVLDEYCMQHPINPYGASKRAVENLLENYEAAFDLNYVIFRYFNVAGADPDAEIGEYHQPETHLIPLLLDAATGKRDKFTIFGTDYDTVDGTCIRDYVHVCDVVDAHVLGLEWLFNGRRSRVFNLGTGKGFSVREVITQVEQITGLTVPSVQGEKRLGDCVKLVSGSSRAKMELLWSHDRSTLDQMITDAWRWQQCNHYVME